MGKGKVPKPLAKSRSSVKFIQEGAKKPKKFYQDVGLVGDPNRSIGPKRKKKTTTKTKENVSKFVRDLEAEANKPQKKRFKLGKEMCKELEYYIQKYGDNFEAMARDKKNIYQDSPGQLRYKINKYNKIHKVSKV